MKFTRLDIPDLILIEPRVFDDPRGFFLESYHQKLFAENGIRENFVQDNHSRSARGVLRGLHYQLPPASQAKLVRVIRGSLFDVCVDIRRGSKTFGKSAVCTLSARNRNILYVPAGFAHGFCVLEDDTECLYKVSDFYAPEKERGIIWNDPDLGIQWPKLEVPYTLSQKDGKYPQLRNVSKEELL